MDPRFSRTLARIKEALQLDQATVRQLVALGTLDKVMDWVRRLPDDDYERVSRAGLAPRRRRRVP